MAPVASDRTTDGSSSPAQLATGARVKVAREQVAQIRSLTGQIDGLKRELRVLVQAHRPELLAEVGCGELTAALLIGRTAGAERFKSDASFRAAIRERADPVLLRPSGPSIDSWDAAMLPRPELSQSGKR